MTLGESTTIRVRLLDAAYQRAASDRKRLVALSIVSGQEFGRLSPPRVVLDEGAVEAEAIFQATARGRVTIEATSVDLAPARTLVSVFPSTPSKAGILSLTPVHAESPLKIEIAPKSIAPVPANNKTPAELHVLLDRILERNVTALIRVTASGSARIAYKDRAETGSLDFRLGEGEAQSSEIHLCSAILGRMVVTATALNTGSEDRIEVEFQTPRPDRILLQTEAEVQPQATLASLDLRLADQDGVPVFAASQDHVISLSSDGAVQFTPERVRLAAERPRGAALASWREFPEAGFLTVLARDPDNALDSGRATIALRTRATQVRLTGPAVLPRKGSATLSISLGDKSGQLVAADRARPILLSSDSGDVLPPMVEIARGERVKTVRYTSPKSSGLASVRADSDGLDAGVWHVSVVIAGWVLLSFAAFGGLAGALARLVYNERVRSIVPRWVNGVLEPGLLVNSLFGGFFGIVLYQAVLLGVLGPAGFREPGGSVSGGPQTLAFFVGSMGGYAGLVALDYLLSRVLPGRGSEARAAEAGAG